MVNKRVCDRITILVLMALIASSLSITHVSAYEIGVYTFCKDVDKSTDFYKPVHPTNVFEDTDKQVAFMITLYDVEKPHLITLKWFRPDGNLEKTIEETFDDPKSEGYDYWTDYTYDSKIVFQDKPPTLGQWKLELYIDNKLELSEEFEILSTATTTQSPQPTETQTITVTDTTTITPTTQQIQETKTDTSYLNLLYLIITILAIALVALGVRFTKKPKMYPQEQEITRYCTNCGKLVRANVSYCPSCGKSIN